MCASETSDPPHTGLSLRAYTEAKQNRSEVNMFLVPVLLQLKTHIRTHRQGQLAFQTGRPRIKLSIRVTMK